MLKKYDFFVRLFVIILALLQPYIVYQVLGDIQALSLVWGTPLEPLFIATNALTSYHLFSMKKWELPALCLLLLTSFSLVTYPIAHDIIAICFFVSVIYPLYMTKRFKYFLYLYLISLVIGFFWGIFWMEVWGIVVMCVYHLFLITYKRLLRSRKNSNSFR
jgi:hypothetical protein